MNTVARFLTAVLGTRGADALIGLSKSSDDVQGVLVPRVVLSWLRNLGSTTVLPGVDEIGVTLRRSESGFTGSISTPDFSCELDDAPLARAAAVVTHALGASPAVGLPRDIDLARFGSTVDRLVKANVHKEPVEGRGTTAGAIAPTPPTDATATAPATNKPTSAKPAAKFKLPKIASKAPGAKPLKLSEPDTARKCSVCKTSQFQNGKFKGCYCIRGMVKSIPAERTAEGWTIRLDRLNEDEASMVIELFKGAIDGG